MGLNISDPINKDDEEAGGVWVIINGTPALLDNYKGLKHTFMAETADAKALEPCTLTEAKCCPNWLWWEKAIEEELATLEAAGT
jgi:hypothetical protein